jgi:non-specific serine/threonine protein kinase
LIVLDTCEHLLPDIVAVVVALLRACPRVRVLATSRQRLAIGGETLYRLPPLALPETAVADIEEAQRYAAVELFVRRAVSAERTLSFTAGSAETLAAICRTLDGIPLSIELAAARAGTLGLQMLAARLRDGFELTNINRDVPPRHRSSQASIEWSYRLLTNDEQTAFTQLAVFSEPFTLDECERICVSGGLDEIGIPDILSGLVEKSFIEVDTTGAALQYRMLNTMRGFAARLGTRRLSQ